MTKRFRVIYAGFDYCDPNGCCNAPSVSRDVNWVPKGTIGTLAIRDEAFRSGKYIGSSGDGIPKRIIKAEDGNYYGLGYGFELEEIPEERSDRKKAIEWWSNLDDSMKMNLCRIHFSMRSVSGISVIKSLTGREIEQIWRKETQQKSLIESQADEVEENAFKNLLRKEERSQVDFELLKIQVIDFINDESYSEGARNNFKLFFELLSKSSTFAHKAHKELNKLMK